MSTATRIVTRALKLESEGLDAPAAFAAACAAVAHAPAAARLAQRILDGESRRARRVEVCLPNRDVRGRFAAT